MIQHTAQHLISAVALPERPTLSWSLGVETSTVDLTGKMTEEEMEALEQRVNAYIVQGLPVSAQLEGEGEEDTVLRKSRNIAMAKGHETQKLRIVSIKGLDSNTCCGTHVSNLSHLQSIVIGSELDACHNVGMVPFVLVFSSVPSRMHAT